MRVDHLLAPPWDALLDRFVDYLVSECGLSQHSIDAYTRDLREFCGLLSDRALAHPDEINPTLIQSHLMQLDARGLALTSIARHVVSIRIFFRYLFLVGESKIDHAANLETPKRPHRLPNTIHPIEMDALLAAPDPDDPYYLRDRAILEFLYATGLRVSELANLSLADVNLDVGFVRCFGKGGRERIVPIGRSAVAATREYLSRLRPEMLRGRTDEPALFLSRTGRRMERTNLWRVVTRCARVAGFGGKVSPHTLRHCFATHVLAGGADLRVVQELLGHANVTTTQIYTHVDSTRLKVIHSRCHPRP